MSLPNALAPWKATLAQMSPALALALGPWLRRLNAVISPLAPRADQAGDDPAGYSGLSRRGPYDRLLISEWGVQQTAPLEFLRRAGMGEHLFLDLERKSPQGSRSLVALFDAGPEQLGQPRLVHVALLAVLAARAQRSGAEFLWGIVQQPEMKLSDDADKPAVLSLLNSRSATVISSQHLEPWGQRSESTDDRELWLIGGQRLADACLELDVGTRINKINVVVDHPPPEIAACREELRVQLRPGNRSLRLPALDQKTGLHLLRRPFSILPPRHRDVLGGLRPNFSIDGHRLLVRNSEGTLTAYPLTNVEGNSGGRPRFLKLHSQDEQVVAADLRGKLIVAVTQDAQGVLWSYGFGTAKQRSAHRRRPLPALEGEISVPEGSTRLGPCIRQYQDHQPLAELIFDGAGQVFQVPAAQHAEAHLLLENVTAIAKGRHGFRIAVASDAAAIELTKFGDMINRDASVFLDDPRATMSYAKSFTMEDFAVFFGHRKARGRPADLVAVQESPGLWNVRLGSEQVELRPGTSCRVVGVAMNHDQVGLVVIEDDERTVQHVGLRFSRLLVKAKAPIVYAEVSSASPYLCYSTTAGDVAVISLTHRGVLLELV